MGRLKKRREDRKRRERRPKRIREDEARFLHQLAIEKLTVGLKMGSSVEAIQAAKVYRQLLKAVKKHVDKEEKKSHFIEFISQEFRTSHEQLDLSSIHQKIKLARDYTFLLNSVHHHKDLLFSYNIAVDRSDEMKKVLGKSAASVGLQLPEVYQAVASHRVEEVRQILFRLYLDFGNNAFLPS
ncbi:unnamed protein product [Camellia sinensis]